MARKTADNVQDSDELERLTAPDGSHTADTGGVPDHVIDEIAEHITKAQMDRLLRAVANIDRRDSFRAKGIGPTTHVVMLTGVTIMYDIKGKGAQERYEAKEGEALLIKRLHPDTHEELLVKGLAERPA